jgi:hypothetical protein
MPESPVRVTAIEQLVRSRMEALGISQAELIRRTGYANFAKGERRLASLFDSDFTSSRGLIEVLPTALVIDKDVVETAVKQTIKDNEDYAEAEWVKSFKPYAFILTEQNGRPRQITMAAICNAGKHVRIEFPDEIPADHYLQYVLDALPDQLKEVASFFYAPLGFVINWAPYSATRYDLSGAFVENLPRAHIGGRLSFSLK